MSAPAPVIPFEDQMLPNREIGRRLRTVRESARLRQSDAAQRIEVARTTLVAIENGSRRVRSEEIQKLARLYGVSVNAILRREAVHLDLAPRFRKLPRSSEPAREDAVRLLNKLVSAEVELEDVLGVPRRRQVPRERPIRPGDVAVQAEEDAQELRSRFGLGSGPVLDMVPFLELQVGMRVYVRRMAGSLSGLFACTEASGACVLLNANHPMGRIAQTGAQALGRLMTSREEPALLVEGDTSRSREAKYATAFSRSFLTPRRAVRQRFGEITAGQSHLTRRHVILLAHAFAVSREAIVRRLEDLRLVRRGTWDWFQENGGITDAQSDEVLGHSPETWWMRPAASGPVPQRLALLVREAWKQDLYSEGQLAGLLDLGRVEVRELLDGAEEERVEAAGRVALTA